MLFHGVLGNKISLLGFIAILASTHLRGKIVSPIILTIVPLPITPIRLIRIMTVSGMHAMAIIQPMMLIRYSVRISIMCRRPMSIAII